MAGKQARKNQKRKPTFTQSGPFANEPGFKEKGLQVEREEGGTESH